LKGDRVFEKIEYPARMQQLAVMDGGGHGRGPFCLSRSRRRF
jgi:hypothetical protein